MWREHPDPEVRQAVIRLCDALCSWERSTGRQNLLVLVEADWEHPDKRYEFIADCGKPLPDDSRLGMTPEMFVKAHCQQYAQS
jgi:hypothetical protein